MADKASSKPTKLTRKAATKQVASKGAKPRKADSKSPARKPTKPAAKQPPAHHAAPEAAPLENKGRAAATRPALLAGGNPQIAKAYRDAPVQAYIVAMPGWKRDVGRRLDALVTRTVPGVRKAVKWNSPFYGVERQGEENAWFLSFHCFTKYVKVTFFRGALLRPVPPAASKHKQVRYFHIHEHDQFNEAQLTAWVKQASQLPGERM